MKEIGIKKLAVCQLNIQIFTISTINCTLPLRAIPEKIPRGGGGGGKKANNIFFYGRLVLTFFKLYGSLVLEKI